MSLKLLAIDLGKRSFHCHGIDSDGVVLSRKVSRSKLLETIKELAPETVAMEACASAHFWGRRFLADGRQVLLINPRFVKPFVKGSKNDAADAEGIYEAALRPTMRFVPVKSTEQQDLQSLHRARERVVCARTALINHMRGLLGEYGVILPQGAWRFLTQAQDAIAAAELSDLTRELFGDLLDELRALDLRLDKLDRQLLALCRTNEACRRLVEATWRRSRDRNGARRRGGRRPSFSLRTGACGMDWPRAAPIYDRRQTSARRDWKARQSLSPTSDDSWRPRRHVSFGQTRRSPFPMAERARGEARLQSGDCRARQ